jgi:2-oxoglutarate dehydrogenase E1 component
VGDAITKLPADFTPHRQIKKIYEARREMIETGEGPPHTVGSDRDEW